MYPTFVVGDLSCSNPIETAVGYDPETTLLQASADWRTARPPRRDLGGYRKPFGKVDIGSVIATPIAAAGAVACPDIRWQTARITECSQRISGGAKP